jgi:glycosyltransferase involved in cell wall biosynthesis
MRILFDHQIFTIQKYGGISRYFIKIANEMSAFGEKVCVCAPIHKNAFLNESGKKLSNGCYLQSFPPKTHRIIRKINFYLSRGVVLKWNPEIVHETYFSSTSVAKKNIVLTVYDMIHEIFPDLFGLSDRTSELKKKAVERATHIICISEQTKKDLISYFQVEDAKISVVHLGVDNPVVIPKNVPSVSARSDPYVLYVGLRNGYKNFDKFIAAFASSKELHKHFKIICFGGGGFTRAERDVLLKKGISENKISQISSNDQVLASLYHNASALVYPSLYEGFGLPPLEAMAYNCPVICSNASSIPEVVGDAAEMFDPHDVESIQSAIERVVLDNSVRSDLITRGNERVKLFAWGRCAQKTLDAYRRVLS